MPDKPDQPDQPDQPAEPDKPDKRGHSRRRGTRPEAPGGQGGGVRAELAFNWPLPDTGPDSPPRELAPSQWIGRIVHGAPEDGDCTDPYHAYTDVYIDDQAKLGRCRIRVAYSTDPALQANVSRLYQEVVIPHLIEQYVRETGRTALLDLLPPRHRRDPADPGREP